MQAEKKSTPKGRKGLVIAGWVLGGLVVLFGVATGVAYAVAGDSVPRGTTVHGVDISGMGRAEAAAKLETELSAQAAAPFALTADDVTVELDPTVAGLGLDYTATVEAAGGRSWNPIALWRVFFGGGPVEPVITVDEDALGAALAEVAPDFAVAPSSAEVSYEGVEVVLTEAKQGLELQPDETIDAITQQWPGLPDEIGAAVTVTTPEVSTETAEQVIASYADPAVSANIVATTDEGDILVTPKMIASSTTFTADGAELVATTDAKKLLKAMQPAIKKLDLTEPKDASFKWADGKPTIVKSKAGMTIDQATVEEQIIPLVPKTEGRSVELELVKAQPEFTTADAKALGIKEVTGEFTTYFPDTAYRNNNLPKAAAALNGTVIMPGETFSFNEVVGERTVARGYMAGGAICPGNVICQQLGGGVSQVATTTYNAFFFSGLKHVTHQPHTLYFSRYPAGRESTIDWGHIDVSFYNDTDYGVYIQGIGIPGSGGSNGQVTIKIWSTKVYDVKSTDLSKSNYVYPKTVTSKADDCEAVTGNTGFDVNYKRLWYKDGELVKSEPYFWRYAKVDNVVCE